LPKSAEVLARYIRRFGAEAVLAALRRRTVVAKTLEKPNTVLGRRPIDDSAVVACWEAHMREDPDLADRSTPRKLRQAIAKAARRAFEDCREGAHNLDFIQGELQPKAIERLVDNLQFTFDDPLRGFGYGNWSRKGRLRRRPTTPTR
jgi:hypothetical protein